MWETTEPILRGALKDLFLLLSDHFPQFSGENIELLGSDYAVVETMRWSIPAVTPEYWNKVMFNAPLPYVCSVMFTSGGVQLYFDRGVIRPMALLHIDWRVVIEHWWGG